MAIIYFIIGITYYFSTKPSLGFLSDTILCLSGGYFIPNRKSRALSIFLLSYAGFTTVRTFLLIVGLSKDDFGTKNLFLGMGLIAMSYRSLFATYVYHRLIKSEISAKNILIVFFIASIISVVYGFSFVILCMKYDCEWKSNMVPVTAIQNGPTRFIATPTG